jgi:TorA maturation chaperone TorD
VHGGDGNVTEFARVHAGRANVYRVLADCFLPPAQLDRTALSLLVNEIGSFSPALGAQAQALCETFPPADDPTWEALRVAHARLFVGPFDLLAPPYGSVYLDGERIVMGPSTLEVQQHYLAAGVDIQDEASGPPDHVVMELEFMYFLAYQCATTQEGRYLDASKAFLQAHLARWFPAFAARVQEHAPHAFYRALALVAAGFVAWDERRLVGGAGTRS